jgi:hypothetical protein
MACSVWWVNATESATLDWKELVFVANPSRTFEEALRTE